MKNEPIAGLLDFLTASVEHWKGLVYLKLKKWDDADTSFGAACLSNPGHAASFYRKGLALIKKQEWRKAHPFIQKALFLDPTRSRWMVQYRQVIKKLGDLPPDRPLISEEELQSGIEEDQGNPFLYSELARLLHGQGKWWQEVEALKSAVQLEPADPDLRFRLGGALEHMMRNVEASIHFEEAVRLNPGNPIWYYRTGYALSCEGLDGSSDPEKAAVYFQKAVDGRNQNGSANFGIGVFHQKYGRWKLAAEAYEGQVGLAADQAELHYRLGLCYECCFEWQKAEQNYEKAVAINENVSKWHFRLGFVRERTGQYLKAAESYAAATDHSPKRVSLWFYRLGYVLEMAGNHEASCAAYVRTIEKGSLDSDALSEIGGQAPTSKCEPLYWWNLGHVLELRSEWEQAAEAYRQAVARFGPHELKRYYRLGYCRMRLGDFAGACEAFRNSRIFQRAKGEFHQRSVSGARDSAIYTEYYELLEIRDKTVLYESFHGMLMTCNPYALFLELLRRDEFEDWTHIWVVNDTGKIPEWIRAMENVVFIARDSDAYMRHLSSAKVLINNNTFPPYFIRKEGQIYLNTWHGTPWKTLGKDISNDFMAYGNAARNFLQATHIISPNNHTTDVLIKRYDVEGLYRGVVAETGYPRIDLTLNCAETEKAALKERLGIPACNKVVLYAPTWRGTLRKREFSSEEVSREIEHLMAIDCHVLFRGHIHGGTLDSSVVVPDDITTNELLAIVDVLITDYSSISFDFIATGRPILYYLKDYDDYAGSRGLYFGVEELPGNVVYRLEDLCMEVKRVIQDESPGLHPMHELAKRRFCPREDGSASRRVVDLIFHGSGEEPASPRKHSIVMYAGQFIPNGVTSSVLNLLMHLDYSKVEVTLTIDAGQISRSPERLEQFRRLPAEVRVIPRAGGMNLTLEERWISESFNQNHQLPGSAELFDVYKHAHAREFKRIFGAARFDTAIEFTGYSSFWSSVLCFPPEGSIGFKSIYLHTDIFCEWGTRFPHLERVFRLYPYFDKLISVCESTKDLNLESLSARLGLPAAKFDYCENLLNPREVLAKADEAIDQEEVQSLFESGARVFILIGRLSVEKDHRKLINAFCRLRETRDNVRLIIVGDGPLYPELSRLVKRLKLEQHVHLLGFRYNPFPYLKRADCFVFSSNYEGQGLVLLEAMILNKPIISTDIDVARSVIEGRSGHLVENSVEGLAAGMAAFLDGKIQSKEVDFTRYQEEALRDFYQKTCGIAG